MRQGIWLDITETWAKSQGEFKMAKEKHPSCSPGVQPLCVSEVQQVLLVGLHYKQLGRTLQPVSPLLQGKHHCKQLSIPNIIIYLSRHQLSIIEGIRIELLISWVPVGENSADSNVQSIRYNHKLQASVWMKQNQHRG